MKHLFALIKIFLVMSLVVFCVATLLWLINFLRISFPVPIQKEIVVPKSAYYFTQEEYDSIVGPALWLRSSPFSLSLPDLRRHIFFVGVNNRPDVNPERASLHIGLRDTDEMFSAQQGERVFLLYNRMSSPGKYVFSPQNAPTDLWIVPSLHEQNVEIRVEMQGEDEIVTHPAAFRTFELPRRDQSRKQQRVWEIDSYKIDMSLFSRQRARWHGEDLFIKNHGGIEYAFAYGKQKIDFGEESDRYSLYLDEGNCAIWKAGRWLAIDPGPRSQGFPLIQGNSIDSRVMNVTLWDADGIATMSLNIVRTPEMWSIKNISREFKFVGMKTRTQFIVEIAGERMTINSHDWLVRTDSVWKNLTTAQEIDDYVDGVLVGELAVFDDIIRKGGKQYLRMRMYSAGRTKMEEIELPLISALSPPYLPDAQGMQREEEPQRPQRPVPPLREKEIKKPLGEEKRKGRSDIPLLQLPNRIRGALPS